MTVAVVGAEDLLVEAGVGPRGIPLRAHGGARREVRATAGHAARIDPEAPSKILCATGSLV